MSCVTLVKAALARFLFGMHTLVTVWRVVSQEEDSYWKIAIGIIVLFLEGLHSLCYRKGEELKWVCPSVLIYLATIVPAIWILELKTNRRETLCLYTELVQERMNSTKMEDQIRTSMLMEIMQVKRQDLTEAAEACRFILTDETRRKALSNEQGLKQILDINLNIALKPEQWTRILEQILLVVLILGRWLLPKGNLSRDQFSQLMLVYIGMAADIVEIFEAFRESKVILEPSLTYAILGVWTLSLVQFCLILSGGHRGRKHRLIYTTPHDDDENLDDESICKTLEGQSPIALNNNDIEKKKRIQMDIMAIIASLFLQDGPFICLRMTLIFKFRVISHMNIFFTCKNTLVILLQIYRLLILLLEQRPQYRRQSRIFSLIPPMSPQSDYNDENHISDSDEEDHDYIIVTREENMIKNVNDNNKKSSHKLVKSNKSRSAILQRNQRLLLRAVTTTSEEFPASSHSERELTSSLPPSPDLDHHRNKIYHYNVTPVVKKKRQQTVI